MDVKLTAADAGCWLEGSRGWTAVPAVIRIAQGLGFVVSDLDERTVVRCEAGDDEGSDWDILSDVSDAAVAWMNEHAAPAGYQFGWHDGEFFLWSEADWDASV